MFQGSANVAKGQHFDLVQAAGGTLNASTWLDRTNYFETLPGHELELAPLARGRSHGQPPAGDDPGEARQPARRREERAPLVGRQPAVRRPGTRSMQALALPEGHPYHHPTIGSMEDLDAASLDDVREFFATYYAPNNAVLTIAGDFEADRRWRWSSALRPIHRQPTAARTIHGSRPDHRRRAARAGADHVPLPRIYAAYRIADLRDRRVRRAGRRGRHARLRARLAPLRDRWSASSSWRRTSASFVFPIIGGAAMFALWVTAPGGHARDDRGRAVGRGRSAGQRRAVGRRPGAGRNLHAAGVESSWSGSASAPIGSMYTCLFDEPERINTEVSRYDAVDAGRVREAMRGSPRRGQPRRPDLRPGGGRPSSPRERTRTIKAAGARPRSVPVPGLVPPRWQTVSASGSSRSPIGARQRPSPHRCGRRRRGRGAAGVAALTAQLLVTGTRRLDARRSPRPPSGSGSRSAASRPGTAPEPPSSRSGTTSTRGSGCWPR